MNLSPESLTSLSKTAEHAALIAGEHIRQSLSGDIEVTMKEGADSLAAQVVTEVDRQSEALIIDVLLPTLAQYDLALLSEEREDDGQRLVKDYFWCIDPIDGTLAFTEKQPGFAVSIALVSRAGLPVIGVVYDPSRDRLFSAVTGQGARCNGEAWPIPIPTPTNASAAPFGSENLLLPADRSLRDRPDFGAIEGQLNRYAKEHFDGDARFSFGAGAVLNACAVIESQCALYFKPPKPTAGGGSLWDFAATACLAKESGVVVCDFAGEDLDLNRADSTFMNHRGVVFATSESLRTLAIDDMKLD